MTDAEREQKVAKIQDKSNKVYLKCIGYPGCDGSLPGEPHEKECPCFGLLGPPQGPHFAKSDVDLLLAERDRLQQHIADTAKAVSLAPTVTGLQTRCVKDHSFIVTAILDAQDTFKDTVKRLEAELAKERERVAYLTGSIESRGGI